MNRVEEIEALAERCSRTDYASSDSVAAHNRAADRIRELVATVESEAECRELLAKPHASSWVAYQPSGAAGPVVSATPRRRLRSSAEDRESRRP